jgi:ubiquinol-cytochrome c reductase cytochrome c subunit
VVPQRHALALGPLAAVAGAVLVAMGTLLGTGAGRPVAPRDAATIYLRDCAVCHGADGRGTSTGPTLVGWGAAGVDYALSTGRMPLPTPGATPTRRTPGYDRATIDALVAYVDRLVPGGPPIPHVDPDAGDLAAGGQLFRAQCAACHQWAGQGGALLHREAPPLPPASPVQTAEAIRSGPGAMPTFGDAALDDRQLSAVVRYVDALKQPEDRGGWALWHLGPVAEGGVALAAIAVLMFVLRYVGSRQ